MEDDKAAGRVGWGGGWKAKHAGGYALVFQYGPSTKLYLIGATLIFLFFSVLSADRKYSSRTAVCDYFVQ